MKIALLLSCLFSLKSWADYEIKMPDYYGPGVHEKYQWIEAKKELIHSFKNTSKKIKLSNSEADKVGAEMKSFSLDLWASKEIVSKDCRPYVVFTWDQEVRTVCKENKSLTGSAYGLLNYLKKFGQ